MYIESRKTRLKCIVNELSPIDRLITVLHLFLTTLQLFRYSGCFRTSSRLFGCLRAQVEYYHCVCVLSSTFLARLRKYYFFPTRAGLRRSRGPPALVGFLKWVGRGCHPERSEGSARCRREILRCAQDDSLCTSLASFLKNLPVKGGASPLSRPPRPG
jgi:hypothetical protein